MSIEGLVIIIICIHTRVYSYFLECCIEEIEGMRHKGSIEFMVNMNWMDRWKAWASASRCKAVHFHSPGFCLSKFFIHILQLRSVFLHDTMDLSVTGSFLQSEIQQQMLV